MITEVDGGLRLVQRLLGRAEDARDQDGLVINIRLPSGLGRQFEDGTIEAHLRIVDGELRGVHAHCQPPCPGGQVVPRQRALAARIQLVLRVESQWMGRDDTA